MSLDMSLIIECKKNSLPEEKNILPLPYGELERKINLDRIGMGKGYWECSNVD